MRVPRSDDPQSQTQIIKERGSVAVSIYGGGSFDNRLRGYIAACQADPIRKGERNNRLFKLASGLMEFEHDGLRLSESQLRDLIAEVNAGLPEPLPDGEVDALVKSVSKRPSRGVKENRPLELAMAEGVDLSGLLASFETDKSDPTPRAAACARAAQPAQAT